MKKHKRISIVAVMLSMVIFIQSFPSQVLSVLADALAETFTVEETIDREFYTGGMVDKYNIGNAQIIKENVANRTENTKEYLMDDGTIMVQQYTEPVHYYENGKFLNIDNSLVEVERNGEKVYKNKANSFKVSVDKKVSAEKSLVEIEEDGDKLLFSYKKNEDKDIKEELSGVENISQISSDEKIVKQTVSINSSIGQITYPSLEKNTDITYKLDNSKLTKNIVVGKKQENYIYTFILQSQSLQYFKGKDGSIQICNAEGKMKFIMPVPYIVDSNGNYSNAVTYTLNLIKGGAELTITADAEWINNQASFPIAITPEIKSAKSNAFSFASVYEEGETIVSADKVYLGKKSGNKNSDLLMNFKLPSVPLYYELIGAKVEFDYSTKGMGGLNSKDLKYNVYVAESMEDLSSVSYAEKPQKLQMLSGITKWQEYIEKDLTYKSSFISPQNIKNNTLTIGVETTEETSDNSYIMMANGSDSIEVIYWYQRIIGIEDKYSMENFSVSGATSYVNNATGYLTSVIDLASVNTLSEMPFEASLVYNDNYDALLTEIANDTGKTIRSAASPNYKLNFQQFIIQRDGIYEMIDADGSISTFYTCSTNGLYYSKEKKLYYNSQTRIAYDLVGNQMYFNTNGCLIKIVSENNPTEYINVVYTSNYSEVDKVDYYFNSSYKYTIDFTYADGKLTEVTTNADNQSQLTLELNYNDKGQLCNIVNKTGGIGAVQTLTISYDDFWIGEGEPNSIEFVLSNQNEILEFTRDEYENRVETVKSGNATSIGVNLRWDLTAEFIYDKIHTYIAYRENNGNVSHRYVSFNNAREIVSEWQQGNEGLVSVQATNNWKTVDANGTSNYVNETYSFYHSSLPTSDILLNANGGQTTTQINAKGLKESDNVNYRFAVILKIENGNGENAVNAGINLSVKIGNKPADNVVLEYGGNTYVVIPCDYYADNTSVVLTNRASGFVNIRYISYCVVNSVMEAYTYNSSINAHNLSSTAINLTEGNYVSTTYDAKQRVSQQITSTLANNSQEVITFSYYDQVYEQSAEQEATDFNREKLWKVKTVKGTDTTETTYTYDGTWDNYTEKVVTVSGNDKLISTHNINRGENIIVTNTDENNVVTKGVYGATKGDIRLKRVESGSSIEEYEYNGLGQIISLKVKDANNQTGNPLLEQYDYYDQNGIYLGSSYGGEKYTLVYDDTGYITSIGYGGTGEGATVSPLLQYEYNSKDATNANALNKKVYANGNVETYSYNNRQYTVNHKTSENGSVTNSYIYDYNTNGQMTGQIYRKNGISQVSYKYLGLDDLYKQRLQINGLHYYAEYSKENTEWGVRTELLSLDSCVSTDIRQADYYYNGKGQLTTLKYEEYDIGYAYDNLGRIKRRETDELYGKYAVKESYEYKTYVKDGVTYTSNALVKIDDQTNNGLDRTAVYDQNGYISEIGYNGKTFNYTYDTMGRLTSETYNGNTITYTYDDNNNILKTGLTYTNGKLTAVNGQTIEYDAMGNPTEYKGNTFVWEQGRKLTSGSMNGKSFTYAYDGNGMRYKKTVNGVKTNYYYDGTQLLMESRNAERIWYVYGATGIEGISYQHEIYYFDKNTLGDVVAIRDELGNVLAKYEYDAWGNVTVMNPNGSINYNASFIGNINPIRYRGYYYDNETGFYYLQTRYYDPTICRFINADNYELVAQLSSVAGQLNMYAYCNNNPIMLTDESGEAFFTLAIAFLIGAGFSAVASVITQMATTQSVDLGQVALAGLFGGASSMLAFTGFGGAFGQFFLQGILSAGQTIAETALFGNWGQLTAEELISDFAISGILGTFGANSAKANFRRVLQIEKSLVNVVSRDLTRKGVKVAFNTLAKKSTKYVNVFIKDILKNTGIDVFNNKIIDFIIAG